jgi:acyl transferase domain-containing protein
MMMNGEPKTYPRRAGISSFGAGGANAHVIIEEYVESETASALNEITAERPALVVLSAKTEERLKAQASQLAQHLAQQAYPDRELANIAYTLQVGREAMEHRLAFTAVTIDEVQAKLAGYVAGKSDIEACYRGEVRKNKEVLVSLNADESLQELVIKWVLKGKCQRLLDLWTKGLSFDWARLYGNTSSYRKCKPKSVSLPTYPFSKNVHWVNEADLFHTPNRAVASDMANQMHNEEQTFDHAMVEGLFDDLLRDKSSVSEVVARLQIVLQD